MIKRENLSEKLAKIISNKIIFDELKSNETIYETQLAKEWGISRSPVRDALHWLEQKRLVEKTPPGNYRVIELTPRYIENFYDVLNMFYGYSLSKATKYITDKKLQYILSISKKINNSVENKEYEDYLKYVSIFGQTILEIARNPIIEQSAKDLMLISKRIMYEAIRVSPSHLIEANKYIIQSYENLLNRDPDKAKKSFPNFANTSRSVLLNSLKSR